MSDGLSLGDALNKYINSSRLKPQIYEYRITAMWEKLMGKTISKYTESIRLYNNTLVITTSVAPLKHELIYSKSKIIELVNKELGVVIIKEVIVK